MQTGTWAARHGLLCVPGAHIDFYGRWKFLWSCFFCGWWRHPAAVQVNPVCSAGPWLPAPLADDGLQAKCPQLCGESLAMGCCCFLSPQTPTLAARAESRQPRLSVAGLLLPVPVSCSPGQGRQPRAGAFPLQGMAPRGAKQGAGVQSAAALGMWRSNSGRWCGKWRQRSAPHFLCALFSGNLSPPSS